MAWLFAVFVLQGAEAMTDARDIERLRALLHYDPATGVLYWKERPVEMFTSNNAFSAQAIANSWNGKMAGKPASSKSGRHGYRSVQIDKKLQSAHRVIWAIVKGAWPEGNIDHINHDRQDNRIENLRIACHKENARNMSPPRIGKELPMGVQRRKNGTFQAIIRHNGKAKHIGTFKDLDAAVDAWEVAKIELGFHPNHGKPPEALKGKS